MKRPITTVALRLFCVALVLTLLACMPATSQTNTALPADKIAKIETAITSFMSRQNVPALSIAIVADNQIRLQRGYGMADLEHFAPAKAPTVYRIASISKPITAVAVMQLVESGKLDLDAPIQKYVPNFPTKAHPVTTRQLLAHLSGIRHYQGNENDSTRHYANLTEALAIFKDDPLQHAPGERFTYSTYGYTLLGTIIEGASGMSYTDYLRERVFKPVGMTRTRADNVFDIVLNRAQGYGRTSSGELRNAALDDTSYKIPGGGLVSSAEDLANFALAVQSGKLIKSQTFEQMSQRQKMLAGQETPYGLGWFVGGREGGRGGVWHGGAQQGATSDL
ncbi:MAG: beta-lactamase family protein [Acidobacteriota bacterium]|nr:beta-lactamase family protein [Acidobacteriota bacterium]